MNNDVGVSVNKPKKKEGNMQLYFEFLFADKG